MSLVTNFTANATSGTAPLTVQFTDLSTPTTTGWYWLFGDSGTSTDQNPVYTYLTPGVYSVTLMITSPSDYPHLTQTNYITVDAPPPIPNLHRVTVQGGNIVYSSSDSATAVNLNVRGVVNVRDDLTVGDNSQAGGTITSAPGQDLLLTTGLSGNLKLSPSGNILINNVSWPSGSLNVTSGMYLGASSLNTLEFYSFVIGFESNDNLNQAQLNALYPDAQAGQFVAGPTVMYQCISAGTWRRLTSYGGTVTSVDIDASASGLAFLGGPITTSGTFTVAGELNIGSGGTGISATSPNDILNSIAPIQSGNSGNILATDGFNTYWTSLGAGSTYEPVYVATVSDIMLSGNSAIDGVSVPDGSRVLVRAQINSPDNGIYITAAGPWARSNDWAAGLVKYSGTHIFCLNGVSYEQSLFTLSSTAGPSIIVGADTCSFPPSVSNGTGPGVALDIARGGTGQITASGAINALVPTQSGNSSNYLQTDGTTVSWQPAVSTLNSRTGAVTLISSDITSALGYTPVNNAGDSISGTLIFPGTTATITGIPNPINSSDVANKAYVDAIASSLTINNAVDVATVATLNATYNNGASGVGATLSANPSAVLPNIDGYSGLVVGSRVLVKDQSNNIQNGVYNVTQITAPWILTRSSDFDNSSFGNAAAGDFFFVTHGTTQANTGWTETATGSGTGGVLQLGTDSVIFSQFSGAGSYQAGTGISLIGTTISNTGVLSLTTGSGLSTNTSSTGNVSVINTGVTSNIAGTGISVSSGTGAVTISTSAIPNSSLTNSSLVVNGVTISLGGSGIVTAAATTLTGTSLNSSVVSSNLTSVGTLASLAVSGNTSVAGLLTRSIATGIIAAGSNQASAITLTKDVNVVSIVSSGQGVALPVEVPGYEIIVINTSSTTLNVYPNSSSAQIDSNGIAAAFTLDIGARIMFICVSNTQWYSLNATYG